MRRCENFQDKESRRLLGGGDRVREGGREGGGKEEKGGERKGRGECV